MMLQWIPKRLTALGGYAVLLVATYLGLVYVFDTPTVQVQAAWTVAGLLGVIVTALNLRDSILDRRALTLAHRNGPLRVMAYSAIKSEVIRFTKMLTIMGIGIASLLSTPAITEAQRKALHIPQWTPIGILLTAGLFYLVIATIVLAIMDRQVRKTFYRH